MNNSGIKNNSISTSTNPKSNYNLNKNFTFKKSLKRGSRGAEIIELQNFLINKNFLLANLFSLSNPKGSFGPSTEKALKAYQKSIKLETTGAMGPKTRAAINAEIKML